MDKKNTAHPGICKKNSPVNRGSFGSRPLTGGKALLTVLVTAAAIAVLAVFLLPWLFEHMTDGYSIYRTARGANVRRILWEPPRPLDITINKGVPETYEPTMSADGLTLIFTRGKASHNADLFLSTWNGEGWDEPEPIEAVNSDNDELGPALSRDGLYLYFYSNRRGGLGGYDIWVSRRSSGTWTSPENMGPGINSGFNEYGPGLSPGHSRLYFSSNRPLKELTPEQKQAWSATLRENFSENDYDIFAADALEPLIPHPEDGVPPIKEFGPARRVDVLNSRADEGQVTTTPRGDFIYFSSNRAGGIGEFDLYRSRVLYGEITVPENMGTPVNSASNDMDPSLTMEGQGLLFSSNRRISGGVKSYRIFRTVSREVITEMDLSSFLAFLRWLNEMKWPLLFWLLGLLALLWLLRYLRSQRFRMYASLLQKCLLASMLLHLLLAFLLSSWIVGGALYRFAGNDPLLVNIDSLAGERIGIEIREQITDLDDRTDIEPLNFQEDTSLVVAESMPQETPPQTFGPADPSTVFAPLLAPAPAVLTADESVQRLMYHPTALKKLEPIAPESTLEKPSATTKQEIPVFASINDQGAALQRHNNPAADALEPARSSPSVPPSSGWERSSFVAQEHAGFVPPLDESPDAESGLRAVGMESSPLKERATPSSIKMELMQTVAPVKSIVLDSIPRPGTAAKTEHEPAPSEPNFQAMDKIAKGGPFELELRPAVAGVRSSVSPATEPVPVPERLSPADIQLPLPRPETVLDGKMESFENRLKPLSERVVTPQITEPKAEKDWEPAELVRENSRPQMDPIELPNPEPAEISLVELDLPVPSRETAAEPALNRYAHGTPRTYHGLEMKSQSVVFCLDMSASMEWNNRIGDARQELIRLLDTLDEEVKFNIIVFSGRVRAWNSYGVQPGTTKNINSAKRFVRNSRIAMDGTNTVEALMAALADDIVESIYFLSDGHPTVGFTTNSERILKTVKEHQQNRGVVIHTIAYVKGDPPREYRGEVPPKAELVDLMKRLADQNSGNFVLFE